MIPQFHVLNCVFFRIRAIPNPNEHFICSKGHTITSHDFHKMLYHCGVDTCELHSFGYKTPNTAWATDIINQVRGGDPNADIYMDYAARYSPDECPWGPEYVENEHYAVLVKHNPTYAFQQGWTSGRASHYMIFAQIQSEIMNFGQVPCFGTCSLESPARSTPMLVNIQKLKVYGTFHHIYKEYMKDFSNATTAFSVKKRLGKLDKIAEELETSSSKIRFEGTFIFPKNFTGTWVQYFSYCRECLRVSLICYLSLQFFECRLN